jgi:hypothetical protein
MPAGRYVLQFDGGGSPSTKAKSQAAARSECEENKKAQLCSAE